MPAWGILALLPAFESGFWVGQLGLKRRQREKDHERLVWGRKPATRIMFVDDQLKKAAGVPTKNQARVSRAIVGVVRWIVNTKAFEYAIQKFVRDKWHQPQRIDPHVRLCV